MSILALHAELLCLFALLRGGSSERFDAINSTFNNVFDLHCFIGFIFLSDGSHG